MAGSHQIIVSYYQGAVIRYIREEYLSELPVGAALVMATEAAHRPVLVVAPTMPDPGNVVDMVNANFALRGAPSQ